MSLTQRLRATTGTIRSLPEALTVLAVVAAAAWFGRYASAKWIALTVAGFGALIFLRQPMLGLPAMIVAALVFPVEFDTGTDVKLNIVTLLVPALLAIWLLGIVVRAGKVRLAASKVNPPLAFFLLAGIMSLFIGMATWDTLVPRRASFTLVQLAQWSIFALSAGAFWLTANTLRDQSWLKRLVMLFLLLGGGLAIGRMIPGVKELIIPLTTFALIRAPFWVLLAALSAGQLLFNRSLTLPTRVSLAVVFGATLVHAFVLQRQVASNWVGIGAVIAVLVWLRFPKLRWPVIVVVVALAIGGGLTSFVYDFAGGDAEWEESGASRMVLIGRVVEVTMRNPVTGLGPAAYRLYANMKPLAYGRAYWIAPQINSHNNYIDIFAHQGLLGLGLFAWFVFEMTRLGLRLHRRFTTGFTSGYVNGMLAAGVASLAIMMLADWILPFVYNIGFGGFQASILVWLFMGGLVVLDNLPDGNEDL